MEQTERKLGMASKSEFGRYIAKLCFQTCNEWRRSQKQNGGAQRLPFVELDAVADSLCCATLCGGWLHISREELQHFDRRPVLDGGERELLSVTGFACVEISTAPLR